jgi:hypothetical protein
MADDLTEFTDVASSPQAQAAMERLLADADKPEATPRPQIETPRDGFVTIPGGIKVGEETITEVEVQELTGEAEERLAKARTSNDPMRFYNTLLEEGIASVGGKSPEEVIGQMLVGDRETILLGIREATYGPEIELGTAFCEECREEFDATIEVKDIPIRPLESETTFTVPLRKGGKAKVRLPEGADQTAYLKDPSLTDSERNSVLLSRCVITLPQNGEEMPVSGFPSLVLSLGVVDRRNILAEIDKRQPGPRYDGLEIEHECGSKVAVFVMGLVSLFPGL